MKRKEKTTNLISRRFISLKVVMKIMYICPVHHQHLHQRVMYSGIVFNIILIVMIMNDHPLDYIRIILVEPCVEENILHLRSISMMLCPMDLRQADRVGRNTRRLVQVIQITLTTKSNCFSVQNLDHEESTTK